MSLVGVAARGGRVDLKNVKVQFVISNQTMVLEISRPNYTTFWEDKEP